MPTGKIAITGFISDLFMLHYNRHKPDDLSSCVEIYFPIDVTAKRLQLANYKNRVKYGSLSTRPMNKIIKTRYYRDKQKVVGPEGLEPPTKRL